MVNDILLPSSTSDVNVENATITDHQSLNHEHDPIVSVSRDYQPKPPSSYLSMSVGDNRQSGLSDFQDPLFYQQPLHLHYNQSLPFKIESEHETGDRIRGMNKFKLNEFPKTRSVTSRKYGSKKSKSKLIKANQKKKRVSRRNLKQRKQKVKRIHRSSAQQLRNQKKKVLKQRIESKKRSVSKVNKHKSLTSKCSRKSNTINNRMTSVILNTQTAPDKIKQQTNTSIFNSVQQSDGAPLINGIKHLSSTPSNTLYSKAPTTTELEQNSSKKNLRRSKLNLRKRSTSKSKQVKQRKCGKTKLNIRSPVHATLKKTAQRSQNRRSTRRKTKFSRCTSKTLITTGILNTYNENMIKPMDIRNDDIRTKLSSSLFSLKNNLVQKQSTMPVTKNCAQLNNPNAVRPITIFALMRRCRHVLLTSSFCLIPNVAVTSFDWNINFQI